MKKSIEKIQTYTKQAYDIFNKENPFELTETYITDMSFGNISCSELFNAIFNPLCRLPQFNNKSFNELMCEKRQDYDINVDNITQSLSELPSSYRTNSQSEMTSFILKSSLDNITYDNITKFKFNFTCTHPILKKRTFGPSKLNINEQREFFFISPICFVAQLTSTMSGFMLMDTFKSILRYEFMSDCVYDEQSKKFVYDTKFTLKYSIVFIKENWMKAKIQTEALNDNKEMIMETILPLMKEFIESVVKAKEKGEALKYLYEYKVEDKTKENNVKEKEMLCHGLGNGFGFYFVIIGIICLLGAFGVKKRNDDIVMVGIVCCVLLLVVYRVYAIEKAVRLLFKN